MKYVTAAESGDGAIVDISSDDFYFLGAACREVIQAVGSDQILARTGYTAHAYIYLNLWMSENRPNAAQRNAGQLQDGAYLKEQLGLPTASELLLASKVGDSDTPTVRWKLSRDALLMFDAAIRETINSNFDYMLVEPGTKEEDFPIPPQEIKDILAQLAGLAHRIDSTEKS